MTLPRDASLLWKILYVIATIFKPLFFRLKVEGREHVPEQGGCILVSNHTMGPDFLVLAYACPRQVFYMAKMEIFGWHPLLTKLFISSGVFPVRRGQTDLAALHAAVDLVRSGRIVGMFPEGTRSHTGILQRGKSGASRIAMQAQAPVVPVVVLNSEKVLKRLGRRLRAPEVIVRFGKPFSINGDNADPAITRHNTEKIMQAIAALLPNELRGEYATSPKVEALK
ncbi:MAG: lysophospholipid acyltransferase family protein [Caldilineaceae bacterium]